MEAILQKQNKVEYITTEFPKTPIFDKALNYIEDAHYQQIRKSTNEPYTVHLKEVASILSIHIPNTNPFKEELVLGGLLHDTLEDDKNTTIEKLKKEFGSYVAMVVLEATTNEVRKKILGKKVYIGNKMHVMGNNSLHVKIADRISNFSDRVLWNKSYAVKMYIDSSHAINRTYQRIDLEDSHYTLLNLAKDRIKETQKIHKINVMDTLSHQYINLKIKAFF